MGYLVQPHNVFDLENNFTIPDTLVGRTGEPGKVTYNATLTPAFCLDYGLEEDIPLDDVTEGKAVNYDALGGAAERVTDLVDLDRERRVANKAFDGANYKTGLKVTLSGAGQFTDPTSSPITIITNAIEATLVFRPNVMTIGRKAWKSLRVHPEIIQAVNMNDGDKGIASLKAVAELFELQEINIGESVLNVAKKGQAVDIQKVWGPHIQLQHRNPLANNKSGVTWGGTMQYGDRVASQYPNKLGLRGGITVRVGETLGEEIFAKDVGYFIENVVAA